MIDLGGIVRFIMTDYGGRTLEEQNLPRFMIVLMSYNKDYNYNLLQNPF